MSKGSKRRPSAVSSKQFNENWDRAFNADYEHTTALEKEAFLARMTQHERKLVLPATEVFYKRDMERSAEITIGMKSCPK